VAWLNGFLMHVTKKRIIKFVLIVIFLVVTFPWWSMMLWMSSSIIYGKIDTIIYAPQKSFNAHKWKSGHEKYRHSVLNHVVTQVITQGMSEEEVLSLLGKADYVSKEGDWQYETEFPGWRLIDWTGGGLLVHFDENRSVTRAENNTWVD